VHSDGAKGRRWGDVHGMRVGGSIGCRGCRLLMSREVNGVSDGRVEVRYLDLDNVGRRRMVVGGDRFFLGVIENRVVEVADVALSKVQVPQLRGYVSTNDHLVAEVEGRCWRRRQVCVAVGCGG